VAIYERPPMPPDAVGLPARCYTELSWFLREREVFFGKGWVCVGRTHDLAEPGDYRLVEIAGESLIVLRDRDGLIRAFFNVCRHRGTRLLNEAEGRLGNSIQCPYHSWTYRLDGSLRAAPHMESSAAFQPENLGLIAAAVEEWDGHLFVSLEENPPPLAERLEGLVELARPYEMGRLKRGARVVYEVKANWKLIIQNYSECLHCPANHPALKKVTHYLSGDNGPARPGFLGGSMDLLDGVETMSATGKRRTLHPNLPERLYTKCQFYAVLPNLLLTLQPDSMMTHLLWPRDPGHTTIVCDWHYDPSDLNQPDFDPSPEVELWDQTNREDWRLSELTQLGMASRAYRPGPYSNREDLLYAFDRLVVERVGDPSAS